MPTNANERSSDLMAPAVVKVPFLVDEEEALDDDEAVEAADDALVAESDVTEVEDSAFRICVQTV
ncbi:hypothetical protein HK405_015711, partial [Cladochytrium tenue]